MLRAIIIARCFEGEKRDGDLDKPLSQIRIMDPALVPLLTCIYQMGRWDRGFIMKRAQIILRLLLVLRMGKGEPQ